MAPTGVESPLGVFLFTGVHNPTTGGIAWVPGLWIDPDHNTAAFFVDGVDEPETGAFTGDMLTHVSACPTDTWNTSF